MIDQVMSGSDMKKRRVASFPIPTDLESLEDMNDMFGYLHIILA